MNYLKLDTTTNEYHYDFPLNKLEYFRLKNFLTNKQMAEKLGISFRNYQRITSGKYKPKNNIHVKTAKAIYDFLQREGK